MRVCKDPRLTYLNDAGYNVVLLPRRGIVPLGVIGKDVKQKVWLGTLDQIWSSRTPIPALSSPEPVVGLGGTKSSNIKASFGLDILGNILQGMLGEAPPSINSAYAGAESLQFAFRDIRSVTIDPFRLGEFLKEGKLADRNPFVTHFLLGGKEAKTETLVITDILEAKAIGVIGSGSNSVPLDVNLPQLQASLGAKISVVATNSRSNELTYEGTEYLTFGFKAFGIRHSEGHWEVYGAKASASMSMSLDDTPQPIVDRDELVEMAFQI